MKKNNFLVFIGMSMMLTGCATVQPGEVGVKTVLGKMDSNLVPSGMSLLNPFTDHLQVYSLKQNTVEGEASPLTSDQQPIKIKYKVLFSIPDSKVTTLFEKYSGDPYSSLVDPQVQEAFRQVISQYKSDAATRNVSSIKDQVLAMVKQNLNGLVTVADIPIVHVDLPEVLQKAIADKQVMEQQSLQKAYELDKAKKEAEITVANAKAQAESIKLQTEALQKSPQLVQYEAVKKWNGQLPTTLITKGKNNMLLQVTDK